ncbi:hypothetical protein Ddye_007994 [Dipteronia dyeriana]|uniref:Reverse transcriptase domain-containing protein n=1 Tax=Dipteronia dyeriana TaxID=168575 RepID=A0AAE0CKW9_9ROSI|nr:hypothetical protein Ddye_007994 [Dipteronia dyeriana]
MGRSGRVRKLMEDRGIHKPPGWSYIEFNGTLHQFLASKKSHPQAKQIELMLKDMIMKLKYGGGKGKAVMVESAKTRIEDNRCKDNTSNTGPINATKQDQVVAELIGAENEDEVIVASVPVDIFMQQQVEKTDGLAEDDLTISKVAIEAQASSERFTASSLDTPSSSGSALNSVNNRPSPSLSFPIESINRLDSLIGSVPILFRVKDANQRTHSWTLLRRLAGMASLPWICLGDFNEILDGVEKMGGIPKNWNLFSDFRETLDDCGLDETMGIAWIIGILKMGENSKMLFLIKRGNFRMPITISAQSCNPSQNEIGVVLDNVSPKLSYIISHFLDSVFTKDDILKAVIGLGAMKAPGKDGLPVVFYQKLWDKVGSNVTVACLDCLNNGGSLEKMNETLICLIPKKNVSDRISDFRPISLCNVLYKIVAKTIVNRFRLALDGIISKTQSAFIRGRLKQRKMKHGSMAIKLDMSKAFDRVE